MSKGLENYGSKQKQCRSNHAVSLQKARMIALRVFASADEDLKKDREEEARIMLKFWDDE